jgi:hypothetical protein
MYIRDLPMPKDKPLIISKYKHTKNTRHLSLDYSRWQKLSIVINCVKLSPDD